MTKLYRAVLATVFLAGAAHSARAQSAPMGAPSDSAPPAPLQRVTEAMSVKGKTPHARRLPRHQTPTRKPATR